MQQKYGNLKNVAQLDFKNPYENIDEDGNLVDMVAMRQGNLDFQSDELQEYNIPRHKAPIEYFKILRHDLYETEKRYLPNIILTVTKSNEVFMWQENLSVVSSFLNKSCSQHSNLPVCMSSEGIVNIHSSMQPSSNSLRSTPNVMWKLKLMCRGFSTPPKIGSSH
jgi:hypothetical protein